MIYPDDDPELNAGPATVPIAGSKMSMSWPTLL